MEYRDIAPIMGRLWSPLAAVTSEWQGKVNAQIAVAITAASIVPDLPRVLVQIYKENYSHRLICQSHAFGLNFPQPGPTSLHQGFRAGFGYRPREAEGSGLLPGRNRRPYPYRVHGVPGMPGGQCHGRRGYDVFPGRRGGWVGQPRRRADVLAGGSQPDTQRMERSVECENQRRDRNFPRPNVRDRLYAMGAASSLTWGARGMTWTRKYKRL